MYNIHVYSPEKNVRKNKKNKKTTENRKRNSRKLFAYVQKYILYNTLRTGAGVHKSISVSVAEDVL